MNNKFFIAGTAMAALCLQACTDDNVPGAGTAVEAGSEIRFGAELDENGIRSRTIYGDPETTTDGKTVWPIYWNYPDNLDQIFIYTPQGNGVRNQASYTVNPEATGQRTAAKITKLGAFGVQVGDSDTPYDFYALYPASAMQSGVPATGTSISATLTADQSVTFAGTADVPATVVPPTFEAGAKYVTNPDMTSCLMIAERNGVTITADSSVDLLFTPFSSVLDITIPGTVETNTVTGKASCAVTSVQITANANIAGDFTYDFSTQSMTFGENASNVIMVSTLGLDAEGNLTGIPLAQDNTLRLQVFMLPNPDVTDVKVSVHTSDNQVWTRTLEMGAFQPRQIHKVVLPKLKLDEDNFDYSMWLSQLDPRIYISEISLPGTTSSFSYGQSGDTQMQTLDLVGQFDAGARVFRCSIGLYDGTSDIDGGDTHFGINVNGGNEIMSLAEAVRTLRTELQENRGNEFAVLMVSDYQSNINYPQFYARFKVIADKMVEMGYMPENIGPNTTLGDVKGKVILKLQLNGDGGASNGGATGYSDLNNMLAKIKGWSGVDGAHALFNWWTSLNGSQLFYAPMVFGNIGTFEYEGFKSGVSEANRAKITIITPGMASDAAQRLAKGATGTVRWTSTLNTVTRPDDIDDENKMWYIYGAQARAGENYSDSYGLISQAVNAIKDTYKNTSHNKFYMTYLGGAGGRTGGPILGTTYTVDDISKNFVTQWNTLTAGWGAMPYGWVLFNRMPAEGSSPTDGSGEYLVQQAVRKVISQNNDVNFKLQRDRSRTASKVAPAGDVAGTPAGGPIF